MHPVTKTKGSRRIWIVTKDHTPHLAILLDPVYELLFKCLVIHLCGDHVATQNAKLGLHDNLILEKKIRYWHQVCLRL